ncbi:hypothetical protein NUH86_22680 (plasmid) [Sphingobium sp. JS3065]|nr:hypothetical protein [Sphingobium sp. JS3065]UZW58078.1 hypothetical protein NUH86_22680 [Sphingobium sp. JS3065]
MIGDRGTLPSWREQSHQHMSDERIAIAMIRSAPQRLPLDLSYETGILR